VPNPKDDKNQGALNTPINIAPLPYEMLMTQPQSMPQYTASQSAQTPYTPQYSISQTPHQKEELIVKEMKKIKRKALIGVILLMIPIINLVGIALLVDSLIHYLKLRSR
jgi:hypothetical protein